MKVLALIVVLTLAGRIQHSHSQKDMPLFEGLLESLSNREKYRKVSKLPKLNMLATRIMADGFPDFHVDNVDIPNGKGIKMSVRDFFNICLKSHKVKGEQFCSLAKKLDDECWKPVTEALQKGLQENVKDVFGLIFRGKPEQLEYSCNAKDEEISELSNYCIMEKLPHGGFNDEYYQNHKEEPLKTFKATPTKANLCKAMRHFMPMYTDPVKATCKNDSTVKAYNRYIEASLKYYCD